LALFRNFWAFPISNSDCLVLIPPDREGLLLLNPTAAWIWYNSHHAHLQAAYAEHFGVPQELAREDLRQTFASWGDLPFAPISAHSASVPVAIAEITASYRLDETRFCVRFATAEIANELLPRLRELETAQSSPDYTFDLIDVPEGTAVYRDGLRFAVEPLVTGARAVLLQEITRLAVPGRDFPVILHAGAIGTEKACVILAGASFSGKSTLCVSLMLSGLLCYSDDSAAFTQDFEVAGMPFAISLREGSWPLFPKSYRTRFLPSNLNATTPTAPPIALIFVNYQADAQGTILDPIQPFDALVAIQQSGFWVEHSQQAIRSFLDWICKVPIYRLTYSDLAAATQTVRDLLDT
jgi:hypothetical protein